MPGVIFSQFKDEFKNTKYPFTDTATLTSINGDLTLPAEIFCDASIYIPGVIAPVYIQKITTTRAGISLTVTDYSKQYTATGAIIPQDDSINLLNNSEQQVGLIVASVDLTYFTSIPEGEYIFTDKATSFVPKCIVPLVDVGVTSVGVKDGKQLYGDVWLIGKDGIVFRCMDEESSDGECAEHTIRVDIVGDALFKREDSKFKVPAFVQTINGVPANEYGDFLITVGEEKDILRITNSSEGITIYAAGV